jgi:DNA-binding transcriptional regulator YdaS (Cro superfamily)
MDEARLHERFLTALAKADGNQSRFAKDIGTFQQNVSYWVKRGKALPAEHVLAAERAGYGSRHELRPDLYPLETSPVADADSGASEPLSGCNDSDFTPRDDEPDLPLAGSHREPELPIIGAAA